MHCLLTVGVSRIAQARHDILRKLHDLMVLNADDMARIIVSQWAMRLEYVHHYINRFSDNREW